VLHGGHSAFKVKAGGRFEAGRCYMSSAFFSRADGTAPGLHTGRPRGARGGVPEIVGF
jgi:hypothetical protein